MGMVIEHPCFSISQVPRRVCPFLSLEGSCLSGADAPISGTQNRENGFAEFLCVLSVEAYKTHRKTCKATDIIIYVTLYTINKISKPAEPGLIQSEGRVNI